MKIIFFGSSEFSIAALEACLQFGCKVLQVITTPDQKQGRGMKEAETPVKIYAKQNKLPCIDPATLKSEDLIAQIKNLAPDYYVVSSYGKLIPENWLKIPKLALNVHPSLIPKYRGAAPINWPILLGDKETGITIMEVTKKLDAGDVFEQVKIPLSTEINAAELSRLLAKHSQQALLNVFKKINDGTLTRKPQDEAQSTYARKLEKKDGLIDWTLSAVEIHNLIRGLYPWPNAYSHLNGDLIQFIKSEIADTASNQQAPGEIISNPKNLLIQTGKGILQAERVKPAGKREMAGAEFLRGRKLAPASKFTSS